VRRFTTKIFFCSDKWLTSREVKGCLALNIPVCQGNITASLLINFNFIYKKQMNIRAINAALRGKSDSLPLKMKYGLQKNFDGHYGKMSLLNHTVSPLVLDERRQSLID